MADLASSVPDPELAPVPATPGATPARWYIDRDTELDDRPLAPIADGRTLDDQWERVQAILREKS